MLTGPVCLLYQPVEESGATVAATLATSRSCCQILILLLFFLISSVCVVSAALDSALKYKVPFILADSVISVITLLSFAVSPYCMVPSSVLCVRSSTVPNTTFISFLFISVQCTSSRLMLLPA